MKVHHDTNTATANQNDVKREWQTLTDAEISEIKLYRDEILHDYARKIEAKLREKNS